MSDDDLLQNFRRDGSQPAFATLVERHVNLVYSVARRHVRSPQLAEEVAQSVFLDLARQAQRLEAGAPVVAWLHLVARRTAIDVVRREARRTAREHAAAEIAAMKPDEPAWSAVEPLLDEAVESLPAADRTAVLLRYFENKSLREVGAALGTSEDTAQKRVSRAVDQLRAFFLRRGIAVTAAGLASDLSAHALQFAPGGLSAAISTSALASGALTTGAAVETAKIVAMTATSKAMLAAALVLAAGAGVYEATAYTRQAAQLEALRLRTDELAARVQATRTAQTTTASNLKSVEAEIDRRLPPQAPALSAEDAALKDRMKQWFDNLDKLRRRLADQPRLATPDLAVLSDQIWLSVASSAHLDTEDGMRQALTQLRHSAANRMASKISNALQGYLAAHDGTLPGDLAALAAFFDPPVEAGLLAGYQLQRTGKFADLPANQRSSIVTNSGNIVDAENDAYWTIGAGSYGSQSAVFVDFTDARKAFAAAHDGQQPVTATELAPFLRWPLDEAALEKFFRMTRK